MRKQCRHCAEPACVSVCPVGALRKTPEGPVIYDGSLCMGCRYCMMACPYGIPRYTWLETVPYVRKCVLCHGKIKSGELKQPACTAACPTGATVFEAHCDQWIKKGTGSFVFDFSELEYLSSAGLRSIISVSKKVKPAGGKVVICGLKGPVKEIFDIAGFSALLPVCETVSEAAKKVM